MRNLTKEQANELIKALKTVGYDEVDYGGYDDHIDDADMIYLYNPTTKMGMYIAISDPTDQQCFDEYYMESVEEQFDIILFEKRDLPRGDEGLMKQWQEKLVGKTVKEAMTETGRTRENIMSIVDDYEMTINKKVIQQGKLYKN